MCDIKTLTITTYIYVNTNERGDLINFVIRPKTFVQF